MAKQHQEAGRKGGLTRTKNTKKRGFGSNRELARLAGQKGGRAKGKNV